MITLNDYLYSGDTVLRILRSYAEDLRADAQSTHNQIDIAHGNFLAGMSELLEHNEFLTSQSQRIREFYKYMAARYPQLAFTFRGRIKSLIRAEEKFNGNIVEYVYDYYTKNGTYPGVRDIRDRTTRFRDLIAYRIVISMPKCHMKPGENRETAEIRVLYEIANALPGFLEERGFTAEPSELSQSACCAMLNPEVRPYYRDYIVNQKAFGYRSLHISFFDNLSRCHIEVQLRTKQMDDYAEIGGANHSEYEERQEHERARRDAIPEGENIYFDEAFERCRALRELDPAKVDVNMFAAKDKYRMNDGCGLFRGRLILPYEHLSRFQNDLVD